MKKLAVMGSGNGSNFEAIVRYFQGVDDLEIICISDVEDSFILKRAENLKIKNEYVPFEKNLDYFSKNKFDLVALAGYMQILPESVLKLSTFVNLHPSLLPSFKGKNAIQRSFISGVKVSGITVHYAEKEVDSGRIIAQYPVFIESGMHLDEYEEAIHNIEHKLYPLVIASLLNDKVFDFKTLVESSNNNSGGCSGGCGGCGGCH